MDDTTMIRLITNNDVCLEKGKFLTCLPAATKNNLQSAKCGLQEQQRAHTSRNNRNAHSAHVEIVSSFRFMGIQLSDSLPGPKMPATSSKIAEQCLFLEVFKET